MFQYPKGEVTMKTSLILILISALLPLTGAWAQDDHGRQGNNGCGGNGGGGGENPKPAKHPRNNKPRNRGRSNNGNRNGNRTPNGNNAGAHHFTTGSQGSHGNSAAPNNHFQNHNSANPSQGAAWNHSTQVSPRLRSMGITRVPQPITNRHNLLTADASHSTFAQPRMGPNGAALHASVIAPRGANAAIVQSHMTTFSHNAAFTAQVNVYTNHETIANHYYWHTWNGTNYCHYYDSWGYHWYGWYWGGNCFWTRWYGNNWWWYDPVAFRWCYWNNGGWWWQDPYHMNVLYVYNNNQYVPANSTDGTAAANASPEASYQSKDGTRKVTIVGGDAFLYDTVQGETDNKPVYLGSGVKEAKFSNAQEGKPLQILLVFDDGSFQMFDSDGNAFNQGSNDPQANNQPPDGQQPDNSQANNPPSNSQQPDNSQTNNPPPSNPQPNQPPPNGGASFQ